MTSHANAPMASPAQTEATTRTIAKLPALIAALLGIFFLFGVGFASPMVIHNAAHDARHAFSFPCH
ncbi:MAG: CbtB domain-containing protein [Alphaproteobacteria bacterium]|nr:CbtB domain-containing protein [Alphaproteobacteria bacterium]MDP6516206.1 CbtB domain-containing protein [Alphaproteobacteria bacterium]|tara:strand:+ start:284 stop:481 length:198 start_codon:yes stop_codon:yes gene_type:complete